MKVRTFLITFLCVFLLISCAPKEPEAPANTLDTVTINNSTQINYAPIFFAESEGYFKQYGIQLEVITFNRVTESIPLLATGQLDVYAGSNATGLINILGQEPYVKVVANRGEIVQGECTFQAILVRRDLYDSGMVTGPKDFTDLKIASTKTGARGYELYAFLDQAGLTFDDIVLNDIPSSAYIDAFRNKTLDVIVIPELVLTRLLLDGNAVLISKAEEVISPYQISILAFGKKLIHDNPELGARFMAAYLKGVAKYNQGKTEDNLNILAEKTGEDIELLRQACWIPIRTDGVIDFAAVDPFQVWSVEQGLLDATVTEDQFWDPSFLEKAFILMEKEKK
jgi:NitT/TauT family transport system substrate-binding protein